MHGLMTRAAVAAALLLASPIAASSPAEPPSGAPRVDLRVTARAIPSELGGSVTFDEALGLAARAPAVTGAEEAVAEQRRIGESVSSVIANPTLNVQPGAAKDPLDGQWKYMGETTLMQGWNLSGLPGDRKAAVQAEGDQLLAEARAAALSHRLGAAQAWMELWAAQQSLADSLQEAELAREFSDKMARAAAAAAFTRAEAADAATYAAEAHVQSLAAEGEVVDRGYQLAVAMGYETEKALSAAGPLPSPAAPARSDWPAILEAAGKLPAVAAHKLASDASRARDVEARSSRGWGLGTGVKGTRDYLGTWGAQAVVELSFPIFDRGEREAAPQAAAAARAAGEFREARAVAATEMARSLHEVEHTGEVLEAVEKELVPAAEANASARQASMQAGETTVLEVLVARRVWAGARAKRTRALASHAWARVKVFMLLADMTPGGAK
jgi:outer membrane protein, heavy metal efflux system